MEKARLLVSDAMRLRMADSLLNTLGTQIHLIESQHEAEVNSYTKLLKLEQDKYTLQKETTGYMESLAMSYRDERDYYQKKYKKQRREKSFLGVGLVGVIILMIIK